MRLTTYDFKNVINGFFEMPTELARELLPKHLEPLELRHGSSVFAVTAFDFTESEVGTYQELILAVIVPPLVKARMEFPKSAFYPFLLATSTPESRAHAIERWHLPHYMQDCDVDFDESDGEMTIRAHENDKPIVELSIRQHDWNDVDHLYQCFMKDGDERFKVNIHMKGTFTEHEEEVGRLKLFDHAMCERILGRDIEVTPFREMWMKNGRQTFEELETI
jgi:hypothetical protein